MNEENTLFLNKEELDDEFELDIRISRALDEGEALTYIPDVSVGGCTPVCMP